VEAVVVVGSGSQRSISGCEQPSILSRNEKTFGVSSSSFPATHTNTLLAFLVDCDPTFSVPKSCIGVGIRCQQVNKAASSNVPTPNSSSVGISPGLATPVTRHPRVDPRLLVIQGWTFKQHLSKYNSDFVGVVPTKDALSVLALNFHLHHFVRTADDSA